MLVAMYHGTDAAQAAEKEFDRIFVRKEMPDELPEFQLTAEGPVGILRILTETKLASSNSEARRLIDQGGVMVDGSRVTEPTAEIKLGSGLWLRWANGNLRG